MDDTATLLRRYAEEGSEVAFAELVQRQLDLVYSAALRRLNGDSHRAAEVAQQVFTRLARDARGLSRHTVLTAWLYAATRNAAIDLIRADLRRRRYEQEASAMQTLSAATSDADWDHLRPELDRVIDELADRDRTAVLLRFFEKRPFREVGATLRISEDAARMRVERALEKLRALLSKRGITSTSAALATILTQQAVAAAPVGLAATVTGTALAAGTAVGGTTAAAIHFLMTSKLATTLAAMVVLAVAIGTATHEGRARHAASESLAAVNADVAKHEQRLGELQSRASAAEAKLEEMRGDLVAVEAQAAKAAVVAPAAATPRDPVAAGREFLAKHPEAQQLWDERERANVAAKFAPVFRMLDLTPAQQDQIAEIALQSGNRTTFINGAEGPITLRKEPVFTSAEAEAQMQAILGPEKWARFRELAMIAPTFDLTVKLASALYRTEPLSVEQTRHIMQVFADASPMATGGKPNEPGGIDWRSIVTAAGTVLSPGQIAALEGVQRNFEYQQAVQRLSRMKPDRAAPPKSPSTSVR